MWVSARYARVNHPPLHIVVCEIDKLVFWSMQHCNISGKPWCVQHAQLQVCWERRTIAKLLTHSPMLSWSPSPQDQSAPGARRLSRRPNSNLQCADQLRTELQRCIAGGQRLTGTTPAYYRVWPSVSAHALRLCNGERNKTNEFCLRF